MPNSAPTILTDSRRSGAYVFTGDPAMIEQASEAAGLEIAKLDLAGVENKAELFARLAKSLNFPAYFGANWDALYDSLTDLSWTGAKGWLILVQNAGAFAARHRRDFATVLKLFAAAANYWRGQGKPFWLLVASEPNWRAKLPELQGIDGTEQ